MITILINGAKGRMGQETVKAIQSCPDFQIVATPGRQESLQEALQQSKPDIAIDFTHPECVYENTKAIIDANVHPVIGTTGLPQAQLLELQALCEVKQLGGVIAPNFSISCMLMLRCALDIARYLPHVEIIELHHDKKLDAPSGTAIKTAQLLAKARQEIPMGVAEKESYAGARGASVDGIHVHSIRLPGHVAHEEIIFGGHSETLRLRHDSLHRESFMPGVILACRKVMQLHGLVYGLENLI